MRFEINWYAILENIWSTADFWAKHINDCGPGNHHIVLTNYLIRGKVSGFHIRDSMQKIVGKYIGQKNFCACLEKFRQKLT